MQTMSGLYPHTGLYKAGQMDPSLSAFLHLITLLQEGLTEADKAKEQQITKSNIKLMESRDIAKVSKFFFLERIILIDYIFLKNACHYIEEANGRQRPCSIFSPKEGLD